VVKGKGDQSGGMTLHLTAASNLRGCVGTIMIAALTCLAAATGVLWIRSYYCESRIVYLDLDEELAKPLADYQDAGWHGKTSAGGARLHLMYVSSGNGIVACCVAQILVAPHYPVYTENPIGWSTALPGRHPPDPRAPNFFYIAEIPDRWRGTTVGFGLAPYRYAAAYDVRELRVPHWFLGLVFVLPVLRATCLSVRNQRRRRHGLCPTCGYDLRATPHRCPECGTAVRPETASPAPAPDPGPAGDSP
jgi:hypothetical protein